MQPTWLPIEDDAVERSVLDGLADVPGEIELASIPPALSQAGEYAVVFATPVAARARRAGSSPRPTVKYDRPDAES